MILFCLPRIGTIITTSCIFSTSHINLPPGRMLSSSPKNSIKCLTKGRPKGLASVLWDRNFIVRFSTRSSGRWLLIVLKEDFFWWELETNTKWLLLHTKLSISHRLVMEWESKWNLRQGVTLLRNSTTVYALWRKNYSKRRTFCFVEKIYCKSRSRRTGPFRMKNKMRSFVFWSCRRTTWANFYKQSGVSSVVNIDHFILFLTKSFSCEHLHHLFVCKQVAGKNQGGTENDSKPEEVQSSSTSFHPLCCFYQWNLE